MWNMCFTDGAHNIKLALLMKIRLMWTENIVGVSSACSELGTPNLWEFELVTGLLTVHQYCIMTDLSDLCQPVNTICNVKFNQCIYMQFV